MAETPTTNSLSRDSTPNARFTSQSHTAEDLLKAQTVGLMHLSDFRKRRVEAIEQLSRDGTPGGSGTTTPDGRELASKPAVFKKRKKAVKKGGLSFGGDEEEEDGTKEGEAASNRSAPAAPNDTEDSSSDAPPAITKKRGLRPNSSVSLQPKAMTKSALIRDAHLKENLRREYLQMQEAVKATELILPFVFFDGKNTPGGACRMKKGDFVWLFLERARKVGATSGEAQGRRKDWARIGVDDLMVVRGELIIPHHYDFHHFIVNRTAGYDNNPIFSYAAEPTSATPKHLLLSEKSNTATPPSDAASEDSASTSHLKTAAQLRAEAIAPPAISDADLEGFSDDPALTKVVDRRWYERNKHIYPASMWEDFDPNKDYSKGSRKDGEGNAFFFSR